MERPQLPKEYSESVERTLAALPDAQDRRRPAWGGRFWKTTAALAGTLAAVLIVLPNLSPQIAYAMERIPVIGDITRAVTDHDYSYIDDYHVLDAQVPSIEMEGEAVQNINDDVDNLTGTIIEEFQNSVESVGDEGHTYLSIDYQVITDTPDWFTLKLRVYQGSGSGTVSYKFYNLDKDTGEIVQLSDLFRDDSGYIDAISQDITRQMVERMEEDENAYYWVDSKYEEWNFSKISEDQNFYFSDQGELVIVFDEYEVAPGYMGTPEFAIPQEVYEDFLAG